MDHDTTTCFICGLPVPLETAKTNDFGRAVHEDCYALRMKLEKATTQVRSFPRKAVAGKDTFIGRRHAG